MEIIIHQAILHVLDTTMDAPVLSGGPMELTAEKNAYLQNHIEKLLASDEIRQCRPLPDSAFKNELEHNQDFVDLSCRIAGVLFDYMHAHTTIPGADLAVVDFTRDCRGRTGELHHPAARLPAHPERQGGGGRTGRPDRLLHAAAGKEV